MGMRLRVVFAAIAIAGATYRHVGTTVSTPHQSRSNPKSAQPVPSPSGRTPVAFTQNVGQWDPAVLFQAKVDGAVLWFTPNGVYHQFSRRVDLHTAVDPANEVRKRVECIAVRSRFLNADSCPGTRAEGLLTYRCNYLMGNDPGRWKTKVPNYRTIVYEDIYPGIDLRYHGIGSTLEYDLIAKPGADWPQIAIQFDGARAVELTDGAKLRVSTDWGTFVERDPVVYQVTPFGQRFLGATYVQLSEFAFGIRLLETPDPALALVIDPTWDYSTYLGGSDFDLGFAVGVDGTSSIYLAGETYSADFDTVNALDGTWSMTQDIFLTKFSPDGQALDYSTYLGGSSPDLCFGMAVQKDGTVYLTGLAESPDFPTTPGAFDSLNPSLQNAFVAKVAPPGDSLAYCTYLGESTRTIGNEIAVDSAGYAYVVGSTGVDGVNDFPHTDTIVMVPNGILPFLAKLSLDGTSLQYSTTLGGVSGVGRGVAVDNNGVAYVTGQAGPQMPTTPGVIKPNYDFSAESFAMKINTLAENQASLIYGTYLGGSAHDAANSIAVDPYGSVTIGGVTHSTDFPMKNPYDSTLNTIPDAFVLHLSPNGDSIRFSTYLGGSGADYGFRVELDWAGRVVLAGITNSPDLDTSNALQGSLGGSNDIFLSVLDPQESGASILALSTFVGGPGNEYWAGYEDVALDLVLDQQGCAIIGGYSYTQFPTTADAYDTTHAGMQDGIAVRLCDVAIVCTCPHQGDIDGDGLTTPVDLAIEVDILFFGWPDVQDPFCPRSRSDFDGNGFSDPVDLAIMIDYMFFGGVGPCDPCEPVPPNCPWAATVRRF